MSTVSRFFPFLLTLLALPVISAAQPISPEIPNCGQLGRERDRNACFVQRALEANDSKLCDKAGQFKTRCIEILGEEASAQNTGCELYIKGGYGSSCFARHAYKLESADACSKISSLLTRKMCVRYLAALKGDRKICELLSGIRKLPFARDECILQFTPNSVIPMGSVSPSESVKDSKYCYELEQSSLRESCIIRHMDELVDRPSLKQCDQFEVGYNGLECRRWHIRQADSIEICSEVGVLGDQCYREFAERERVSDYCNEIIDPKTKDLCFGGMTPEQNLYWIVRRGKHFVLVIFSILSVFLICYFTKARWENREPSLLLVISNLLSLSVLTVMIPISISKKVYAWGEFSFIEALSASLGMALYTPFQLGLVIALLVGGGYLFCRLYPLLSHFPIRVRHALATWLALLLIFIGWLVSISLFFPMAMLHGLVTGQSLFF